MSEHDTRNGPAVPLGTESPLSFAVKERDRNTMDMVRDAIANHHVLLAFQPVVQTARTDRPAFYEGLIRVLDHTGRIIPACDFIEVVETPELGRKIDQVFMADLQHRGVAFALDDFGAGYTAFRYLRDFYFDILKIDGQFIRDIHKNTDNQVLTQALISIGRHFEMFTVAEFVETAEEAEFLTQIGIDCMQGYYFGVPTTRPSWVVQEDGRRVG